MVKSATSQIIESKPAGPRTLDISGDLFGLADLVTAFINGVFFLMKIKINCVLAGIGNGQLPGITHIRGNLGSGAT